MIYFEKQVLEPLDNWLDQAAFFSIVDKISPAVEAFGVVLIPLVIWFVTQKAESVEVEKARKIRQQESLKTYLSQLTEIFLNGDIKKGEKSEYLRKAIEANTIVVLKGPNLDGKGKGEIITFLSQLGLITTSTKEQAFVKPTSKEPTSRKLTWKKLAKSKIKSRI